MIGGWLAPKNQRHVSHDVAADSVDEGHWLQRISARC
jgi:hypothetical protein